MQKKGTSHGYKMEAYKTVCEHVQVTERTIRAWVADFELMCFVRDSKRGKHSKTLSPIMNDLEFKEKFKEHVKCNSRKQVNYICMTKQTKNRLFIK